MIGRQSVSIALRSSAPNLGEQPRKIPAQNLSDAARAPAATRQIIREQLKAAWLVVFRNQGEYVGGLPGRGDPCADARIMLLACSGVVS